jgi:hypothetical protein
VKNQSYVDHFDGGGPVTLTSGGYRVTPDRLDEAARELGDKAGALDVVHKGLSADSLPAQAFGQVAQSQQAADVVKKTTHDLAEKLEKQVNHAHTVQAGLTACAGGYRRIDVQVATMYRSLLPESAVPKAGAQAGAPGAWAGAVAENRHKVEEALRTETDPRRIALYQDILANNRQILKFDPSGNGRIAELIGEIQPGTRHVGLFVPGVNTSFDNYQSYANLGNSLVAADSTGRTAMVVWADGVFPQNVTTEGSSASYARAMAPDLAAFSNDLRRQIVSNAGDGVLVTGVGHSYGGATMGLAETMGLNVDQVVHVESAGMGNGVWSPSDLPASQAGVQRFSMTAPLDPIVIAQGNAPLDSFTGIGHGADPDTFPGVTELETGRGADGDQLWGLSSHSDVLKPGSDSWNNIYGVLTGGAVTPEDSFAPRSIGEVAVEAINGRWRLP